MLYNLCHVMLYNICHVMIYNMCHVMLYIICHVMLYNIKYVITSVMSSVSTVMQTLDFVLGLHNCLEFSQPLSCLYQAMQTQKTFSIA